MATDQLNELLIFSRQDMTCPHYCTIAGGSAGLFSARSPAKETDNEDAAAILPIDRKRAVLAVADGLGGHQAGAEAAELALRAIVKSIQAELDSVAEQPNLRSAILNGFEIANRDVAALGVGAGTTLAALEIDGNTVRTYHVGDTEILIVGQRGKNRHQTVSHSPVGYAVEAGLLNETEAIQHKDRHIVSNIVGSEAMRIEIGPIVKIRPRDTIVLASDGLFDNLRLTEIINLVRKGPLINVVEQVSKLCQDRMRSPNGSHPSKPDDLTLLLYRPDPTTSRKKSSDSRHN